MGHPAELTILGSGTSSGVPLIGCKCAVCRSKNPKDKRLRASAWVKTRGKSLLIDTSTDLRAQALAHKILRVDGVLFTHPHADHIHGIDELRAYNFLSGAPIPALGNAWTCEELLKKFDYIFKPGRVEGGGIPRIHLTQIDANRKNLEISGVPFVPISLEHGSKETVGYRFESVAYITDCSYIPTSSLDRMRDLKVLVLDCLRLAPHGTHFNLDQALEVVARVKPKKTFFTHLSHDFGYANWSKKLPQGVHLSHDGLRIRVK
jgi:phosphoribosyl 1,2-cyclic phosphate phosphodiesterase